MIRILLLWTLIVGLVGHLPASPVSWSFQSGLQESDAIIDVDNSDRASAQEHAPEFVMPAMIFEVVRIILMGSALIALAGLWQRREKRLGRFV